MLCRISLEPDSCVRRSKVFFEKGANRTLIFSKWLPGVSHVVPAVAGLSGIERQHFFVTNTAGSALWIVALMLGRISSRGTLACGFSRRADSV